MQYSIYSAAYATDSKNRTGSLSHQRLCHYDPADQWYLCPVGLAVLGDDGHGGGALASGLWGFGGFRVQGPGVRGGVQQKASGLGARFGLGGFPWA